MSETKKELLKVPFLLWPRLMMDLRRRSGGQRESGAFLLGTWANGVAKVRSYICYDELEPRAFESGVVRMTGDGFSRLWSQCRERGMGVVADIHAHPGEWVGQSQSDQRNPMIGKKGHVAFIVPSFAKGWCWRFGGTGIYEYQGNFQWTDVREAGRTGRVQLCLW